MSQLPPSVRALLEERIDSFEKLELVAALCNAPRSTLALAALAAQMKVAQDEVRRTAIALRAASLVELTTTGEVQLLPPTSTDGNAIKELVRLYEDERLIVVKELSEIAMGKIRGMASRAFADAFVLRKKPPGGKGDG